jgi:hypothetical protein
MNWKKSLATGFICIAGLSSAYSAGGCQQGDRMGDTIDLRVGRKLTIVELTIVDSVAQSTLRQKLLVDDGLPLTQDNARAALTEMFDRAKAACRKHLLTGTIMFLYGSKDAVVGTNWLARLDTRNGMTPSIDMQPALFANSSSASICEGPNAPKPKGKEYKSSDEVTLPPVS